MERMIWKRERTISRAFNIVNAFLRRSKWSRRKASWQERQACFFVRDIISGKHLYTALQWDLYGIVGLAMLETRYAYNQRDIFLREWDNFCRGKCPERIGDLLLVCQKIRQGIGTNGIAPQSATGEDFYLSLPEEWRSFVL